MRDQRYCTLQSGKLDIETQNLYRAIEEVIIFIFGVQFEIYPRTCGPFLFEILYLLPHVLRVLTVSGGGYVFALGIETSR